MKDGNSRTASSIASDTSLCEEESDVKRVTEEEDKRLRGKMRVTMTGTEDELAGVARKVSWRSRLIGLGEGR